MPGRPSFQEPLNPGIFEVRIPAEVNLNNLAKPLSLAQSIIAKVDHKHLLWKADQTEPSVSYSIVSHIEHRNHRARIEELVQRFASLRAQPIPIYPVRIRDR